MNEPEKLNASPPCPFACPAVAGNSPHPAPLPPPAPTVPPLPPKGPVPLGTSVPGEPDPPLLPPAPPAITFAVLQPALPPPPPPPAIATRVPPKRRSVAPPPLPPSAVPLAPPPLTASEPRPPTPIERQIAGRERHLSAHLSALPAGAPWARWTATDAAGAAFAVSTLRAFEIYCRGKCVRRNCDGLVAARKAKSMGCLDGTTRLRERRCCPCQCTGGNNCAHQTQDCALGQSLMHNIPRQPVPSFPVIL